MDKKRILLIDDEQGFTSMLRLSLEEVGGFEVFIENDPFNALSSALIHQPDLILLDVIMPKKEGPDVAAELKLHPVAGIIPIVFLTATVTRQEVLRQSGRIGGHQFVAKPADMDYLLDTISRNLIPA